MKMQVIFINGRFLTQTLTGVQRTAFELVSALDQLLAQQPHQTEKYQLIYSGKLLNPIALKHITLVKKGRLTGNLWEQFELPFYTRGGTLVSLCTISTLFKRNQVLMIHDASVFVNSHFFPRLFRIWYKFALPKLGRICRQILTVSQFSKQELSKFLAIDPKKITVIYNAADHLKRFVEPGELFKAKIDKLKPFVLAVSSLSENKNFKIIDDAVRHMEERYNVVIAGARMNTLSRTQHPLKAHYLGYVSNSELKYLYQEASVFIFPSFYEGFGIPPLEAMQMGCPVLSSHTSAMPEILMNNCLYFDPHDPFQLLDRLKFLLGDKERANYYSRQGMQLANSYSWQNSAKQLHKLIRNIISLPSNHQ